MNRRNFLRGISAVAAATIVRANLPPKIVEVGSYIHEQPSWVPKGWMIPQGQELSRIEYPRLFAAIGNAWGGDGITTFRLPDLGEEALPFFPDGKKRGPGYFGLAQVIATEYCDTTSPEPPPGTILTIAVDPRRV